MSGIKLLKKKIAVTKSTLRITSAMKMVAASKLKKAQKSCVSFLPYAHFFSELVSQLPSLPICVDYAQFLPSVGKKNKTLYVIFAADRGLCGSFSARIVKEVMVHQSSQKGDAFFLVVGKKAESLIPLDQRSHIVERIYGFDVSTSYQTIADSVVSKIMDCFHSQDFTHCFLCYSHFRSILLQETQVDQIFPLNLEPNGKAMGGCIEREPDVSGFFGSVLPVYVRSAVMGCLFDSFASEQASRMMAMENSTNNAKDMLEDLSREYNRTRQSLITKELIEIISGSSAV